MKDLLEYPSCKLYKNGRFRLPNKVRQQMESWRIRRVVVLADEPGKIRIIQAVKWNRMKAEDKRKIPIKCPVRTQSVSGSFIVLNPCLQQYLGETETIYFELDKDHYLIWNEADYQEQNEIREAELQKMYYGK